MTQDTFLTLNDVRTISQVYAGMQNCCRCGCKGEYTATSFMKSPRSEVNDRLVKARLIRAQRAIAAGSEVIATDTYVDITTGKNRCLTFYFDEVKS